MKYLFLIFLFIPLSVFSQSALAIKAGVTASTWNREGAKGSAGPNFGITYSATFKKFQLTVEPTFNVKGFSYTLKIPDAIGFPGREEKTYYKFSYIELPITVGAVESKGKFFYGLHAGFAPAYLIKARVIPADRDSIFDVKEKFNLDFLMGPQLGVNLSENLFLTLRARMALGLLKFNIAGSKMSYGYFAPYIEAGYRF